MSGFGIFLLMFTALLGVVLLIQGLAAWDRFLEQGGFRTALDRLAYVNRKQDDTPVEPVVAPVAASLQNSNNGIAKPQNDSNDLLLQAKALAALVKAGKVGETEGIKIVFGVSPSSTNPRYIAARDALKTELQKISGPQYPPRSEAHEQVRAWMQGRAEYPSKPVPVEEPYVKET